MGGTIIRGYCYSLSSITAYSRIWCYCHWTFVSGLVWYDYVSPWVEKIWRDSAEVLWMTGGGVADWLESGMWRPGFVVFWNSVPRRSHSARPTHTAPTIIISAKQPLLLARLEPKIYKQANKWETHPPVLQASPNLSKLSSSASSPPLHVHKFIIFYHSGFSLDLDTNPDESPQVWVTAMESNIYYSYLYHLKHWKACDLSEANLYTSSQITTN